MIFRLLIQLLCVAMIAGARGRGPVGGRPQRGQSRLAAANKLSRNVTALWKKVNAMPDPINIHVDSDQQTQEANFGTTDQHIHIHLSLNDDKDCVRDNISMDEYIYARCDMQSESADKIKGFIYMRQKPKQVMESKILLSGFTKSSAGSKDGKHDFFFDLHKLADFSGEGCSAFGDDDHVHHEEGTDKSSHSHDHGKAHGAHEHDHDHHHSHDDDGKLVHNHDHALMDGWGDVVVKKVKGSFVSYMEQNSTIHQLYGPESIMGRGIVLHDKADKAISCCSITYAKIGDKAWDSL